MISFDIETGPLPDERLREWLPEFEPPKHPGEFDPASVKYGNLKDAAKRADRLESAREDHAAAVANYERNVAVASEKHWLDFRIKAALSPITGRVLAIGVQSWPGRETVIDGNGSESHLLAVFWDEFAAGGAEKWIGWNIFNFDLPFMIRRSWLLGVHVPSIRVQGRYWSPRFVDLMQEFSAGVWKDNVSLDVAARFLGVGRKCGNGADFARLWNGTQEERQQAIDYLRNDLNLTAKVAERIGVK